MARVRGPTVYFFQRGEGGPVKIGFTARNAARRLSEAQVGCPEKLYLLAEAAGTEAHEKALHRHFAAARDRGEWFRPVPELMDLVSAIAFDGLNLASYVEGLDADPATAVGS